MTDLTNVNTFTADTIKLINKNLDKPVNAAEQRVLDEIKGLKPDNDTKLNVLDFGTNGRLLKLLQDSNLIDNVNYTGVNKHSAFIEVAQEIFPESDNIKFMVSDNVNEDLPEIKFDVIVNINNLQREFNPSDLLNEIDLIDSPNKFIVFIAANLYGQELKDDIRLIALDNGARIVNNRFSHEALTELAEKSGLTLRIFNDTELDDIALLLKKAKSDDEIKEEETKQAIKELAKTKSKNKFKTKDESDFIPETKEDKPLSNLSEI